MKKCILFAAAALALLTTSCGSFKMGYSTATTIGIPTTITSANVADLVVGDRVVFSYTPSIDEHNSGLKSCKEAASAALLRHAGNADVLVSPEYKYDTDYRTIEVSGRPAFYKNFRGAN